MMYSTRHHLRSVPGATVEPPRLDATSVGSSEDADVAGAESEAGEVDSGLKRKRATSDDGAGTSKRVRHVSLGGSTSTEEETPDAPPTLAAKEVTETSPPTALGRKLRARFSSERGRVYRRMRRFCCCRHSFADAQAEVKESRGPYATEACEENKCTTCQGRARAREFCGLQGKLSLGCEVFGGGKNNHFAGLDEFRQRVEVLLEKQDEKLRKLSIKYDEELYPYMLSACEPGACCCDGEDKFVRAAICTAELPMVNHIDVIMAGLTLARHATEGAEAQPDYFLKPDVAQLQVPIFACPCDILNPFSLEKEIPLKESLEAHAIRLAKKKGVKARQYYACVGAAAAHIRPSDEYPLAWRLCHLKDCKLLGKLEAAGVSAYRSWQFRAKSFHSI
ncbi:hypothetical protein Tco_0060832 [Tanacetum coccineum]